MREFDEIRHVLELARQNGFTEVEAALGDVGFSARLDRMPARLGPPAGELDAAIDPASPSERLAEIGAPCVGYFRPPDEQVAVGSSVELGQIVATITALGLDNDVESSVCGEVVEVLAREDQPVQYGEPLYRVKVRP